MSKIVLGVSAGIAAYKSCSLLRRLVAAGHDVQVVPTPESLNFVGAATWAALSGRPVHTEVFADTHLVNHVLIGREADAVIVAPATADLIARAATGRADDLLTNVLLTATAPIILAPAMHTEMWRNPATQDNVATLRDRGVVVIPPGVGRLTGPDSGPGRLPEPEDLEAHLDSLLADPARRHTLADQDLRGRRVVVSAGGTREAIDPVRFLGNSSSGLMGAALARAAVARGAEVTLVAAHLSTEPPAGVDVIPVVSTSDLAAAMGEQSLTADLVIMAAAPADFAPLAARTSKIKKSSESGLQLELVQTPDVLAGLATRRRDGQVLVGFAAETASDPETLVALGQAKRAAKGCQLLVANDVSGATVFGATDTSVYLITADAQPVSVAGAKTTVAHAILDAARDLLERKPA